MTRSIRLATAFAPLLIGGLIVSDSPSASAGETKKLTLRATDKDPTESVVLGLDDKLEVRVSESPGTGYSWKAADDSTKLLELESTKTEDAGGNGLPGGSGQYRVFTFRVPKGKSPETKKAHVKLAFTRPGTPESVAKKFNVPIEVKAK